MGDGRIDNYVNVENKAMVGDEWDEEVPVYSVKVTDPVTGKAFDIQAPEVRFLVVCAWHVPRFCVGPVSWIHFW